MKTMLIIGMGQFGSHLAAKLVELGNDVVIIDKSEKIIQDLSTTFQNAYCGDCTNPEIIKSLHIKNFDVCFITIGENFQSSLEITSLLREAGAKYIVSKATQDMQAKFLKQIGADEIVYPERDIAEAMATKFSTKNVFDYIQLNQDYAIYETNISKTWIGKTVIEVDIRKKYGINIIAIKSNGTEYKMASGDTIFEKDDHIIIIGPNKAVNKLTKDIK